MATVPDKTHTSRAFEEELSELRTRILTMGGRCEQLIEEASRAMCERDGTLAARVEAADRQIDADEIEIDELTVRILALRQPVGRDLRFLVMAFKVVTDLERIGDEAANVAERAAQLAELGAPASAMQPAIQEMAHLTREILHEALDAFVAQDETLARAVLERDDEVDEMYGQILRQAMSYIGEHPDRVRVAMCIASTSKYLERIADHATNIAEMVVFLVSGRDVRHPG